MRVKEAEERKKERRRRREEENEVSKCEWLESVAVLRVILAVSVLHG